MAKKFGKFLLLTAAVGSAAAAVFYYLQKKDAENSVPEDDDYDDFSEDLEEDAEAPHHSYVPLTPEHKTAEEPEAAEAPQTDGSAFTPLGQMAKAAENAGEKAEETVEEFFDEEDSADTEPPAGDN